MIDQGTEKGSENNINQPFSPIQILDSEMAKSYMEYMSRPISNQDSVAGKRPELDDISINSPIKLDKVIQEADPLSEEADEIEDDVLDFLDKVKKSTLSARLINEGRNEVMVAANRQMPVNAYNDPRI